MLTKLLLNNDLIEAEDKQEMKLSFDESIKTSQTSENKIVKILNSFLLHPIGVLFSILVYSWIGQRLKDMQRSSDKDDIQKEFENQFRQNMMEEMLNQ